MIDAELLNGLYRYGLALVGNPDRAHDLLQGALLRYLEKPADAIDDVAAYLRRSMRNAAIDRLRNEGRWAWQSLEEEHDVVGAGHADGLDHMLVDHWEVDRIWRSLSAPEREVLFLWAIEGYTIDEIARNTGMARGTLLSRLHRLRRRIASVDEQNEPVRRSEDER